MRQKRRHNARTTPLVAGVSRPAMACRQPALTLQGPSRRTTEVSTFSQRGPEFVGDASEHLPQNHPVVVEVNADRRVGSRLVRQTIANPAGSLEIDKAPAARH